MFIFFGGSGWRDGKVVSAKKNSFEILSLCRTDYYVLCKFPWLYFSSLANINMFDYSKAGYQDYIIWT